MSRPHTLLQQSMDMEWLMLLCIPSQSFPRQDQCLDMSWKDNNDMQARACPMSRHVL